MARVSILERQFRVLLAIMLGVVLVQATPSGELPIHRDHGSAFSAATYELALPVRRESSEIANPSFVHRLAGAPSSEIPFRLYPLAEPEAPLPPRQTGPPAPPPRLYVAFPRAPPVPS